MRTRKWKLASGRPVETLATANVRGLILAGAMTNENLIALTKAQSGELDDPQAAVELEQAVVCGVMISPHVIPADQEPSNGDVSFLDLSDEEINELISMVFEGVGAAERFRGSAGGAGSRKRGAGVGNTAKRAGGDGAGKPRGAGTRPAARAKTPGTTAAARRKR